MTSAASKRLDALAKSLGHTFADPDLLRRALTHSSAKVRTPKVRDYERLEFLGDRVLGLVVAEMLLKKFPEAEEGELARRFNRLVQKDTCAKVAEDMDLGAYVIMSANEAKSGGRAKRTILGDACEAVLGALFVDAGYEVTRKTIRRYWSDRLLDDSAPLRDAKSALQEWAQGKGLDLPQYIVSSQAGPDHEPHFTTRVNVQGLEPTTGEGASKRAAQQAAAKAMLVREGVWNDAD
ncbi:MAG: ribonuclease III [Pseudomonadota bacterium]